MVECITPGPLYNTLRYNMVFDITLITVYPVGHFRLFLLLYMSIHFTLFITWIG